MPGITALRKIQGGDESTSGTAVAASWIWRGTGVGNDGREVKHVGENVGQALPTTRNYTPKLGAEIVFDPVEATFQQLPYIFEAGVSTETPTQDGTGSGYIYAYAFPGTAENTIKTYTLEYGDNQLVQESDYCYVEAFKISGNAGEGVMVEATWRGRDVVDSSFTGGAAAPTLTPGSHIVFGGSTLAIDAVDGTLGATTVSNTLLSFELDVVTGLTQKYTNQGKDFDFVYYNKDAFKATLKMVYEHNASADAQRDLYEANTPRQVRLEFTGDAVSDNTGATYNNWTFQINAAGVYTAFPVGDKDGNATVEAEMTIGHDLTASQGLDFLVVNEDSTLP